jgi:hypothetical protein
MYVRCAICKNKTFSAIGQLSQFLAIHFIIIYVNNKPEASPKPKNNNMNRNS